MEYSVWTGIDGARSSLFAADIPLRELLYPRREYEIVSLAISHPAVAATVP
jgi:hypothetical protein